MLSSHSRRLDVDAEDDDDSYSMITANGNENHLYSWHVKWKKEY